MTTERMGEKSKIMMRSVVVAAVLGGAVGYLMALLLGWSGLLVSLPLAAVGGWLSARYFREAERCRADT